MSKSASLVHRSDGSPLRIIAQVQDITERKEYERAFAEEHRRLRDAESIGGIGSWEMDVATRKILCSDTLFGLYGVVPGDLACEYADVSLRIHPDDRQRVDTAVDACADSDEPLRIRHRIIRASDGELRWFDVSGARDPDGRRVAGAVIDVTERVQAETALADSEARFRLAFDTAPLAMAMIDLSERPGGLLRVNPAMCALTGRTGEQLCALNLDGISHPDEAEATG